MDVFANILRSCEDQWLNFGQLAFFDLMEMAHGLDHDFGPHRNKKNWKNHTVFNPLFCTMWNQWPIVFGRFLVLHDELGYHIYVHSRCRHSEDIGWFGFYKWGPHNFRNDDPMVKNLLQITWNLWWINGWYFI